MACTRWIASRVEDAPDCAAIVLQVAEKHFQEIEKYEV
jgi:hypothetical protein